MTGEDPKQIVKPDKLLELAGGWKDYLQQVHHNVPDEIRWYESTGRVPGGETFVDWAEQFLGRDLKKKKPVPKSQKSN